MQSEMLEDCVVPVIAPDVGEFLLGIARKAAEMVGDIAFNWRTEGMAGG